MLVLQDVFDAIDHALNAKGQPVSRLRYANMAGAVLYAYPWSWLGRRTWEVDIVANTDQIILPLDCGGVISVWPADGSGSWFRYCADYQNLVEARYAGTTMPVIAPTHAVVSGEIVPRLEITPVPLNDMLRGLRVMGTVCWQALSDAANTSNVIVPLPRNQPIFEPLFLEFARSIARGFEQDATTSLQEQVAVVEAGPLFQDARRTDQRQLATSTIPRNTAAQQAIRSNATQDQTWITPQIIG